MIATRFHTLAYIAAATAIIASGMSARADSVTMTFNASQPNTQAVTVNWSCNGQSGVDYTSAGIYNFTVNSISGGNPLSLSTGDTITGLCIDLTHQVNYGQTGTYTVEQIANVSGLNNGVGGMNANQITAISYLWETYGLTATTPALAAELQMAVWDILYNGYGTNLANDASATVIYSSTTADVTTAANWAQQAANWAMTNSASSLNVDVYALVNSDGIQSFAIAFPGSNSPPPSVPLPAGASMGLIMLSSLGCFFGLRRHIRRRLANA
ncbi:MAG: hypothetical protein FWD61_01750 [Phycisphaerales bacterium]|nr:hypothetical protein [Phycisphaerales bacterium]